MADTVESRLQAAGITLPTPAAPAANYIPYVITGNLVFVSGQLPFVDGAVAVTGRLGDGVSIEDGQKAARLCAVNLLAQVKIACGGDLGRVKKVVRLGGFVASAPSFTDQPKVINGASDLMVEAFGAEIGTHARFAVGAPSLPLNTAVEVDGTFEIA